MASRSMRGRKVPQRSSALRRFYLIFALVAVLGAILVLRFGVRASGETEALVETEDVILPLHAPVGQTPDGFFYKGDPNAPVKVIEYADFQCPACAQVFRLLEPIIQQQYVETGKVQFIFHDFPLPMHKHALSAAAAARCAGDQGKFWPMHDLLLSRQQQWQDDDDPTPRFRQYAAEIGVEQPMFDQCLAQGAHIPALQAAADESFQRGITGTPTFVVNGRQVTATDLQAAIEQALRDRER
ncbi:MAG: DSBA oxidoreductase [Herpetosiphonaceae bacterium]|nr:MAG: DSBA oxidoreductase [Herpetosiphonaceae bacterium]